ncbi:STAS domain-containing protein [Priestia megaterium]|uniref:STAS domain-containing protein n=1 Tax=Priestia megaterium TaxID=1404 RepID=UPI00203B5274|nr:STAS domain-containing protein [Priestia megaterium]MCM3095702.1 STAS domain-containing protein [Priestia megaterium]
MKLLNVQRLQTVKDKIIQQKEELADRKRQNLAEFHDIHTELTPFRLDLLTIYAQSIVSDKETAAILIENWAGKMANVLVERELPLNLALEEISYYRDIIGEIILEELDKQVVSIKELYSAISHFNAIIDCAVQYISKSYLNDYKHNIKYAQYAIDELSVPIVRMTETVGILPLVGDLDTKRAQILIENALTKSSEYHLAWLIMDLSAVPIIDTMVADQLFKVIRGLELIGVNVVLSGIRSEIAQTMVGLGIKIDHVKTFASLHQAVAYTNAFNTMV